MNYANYKRGQKVTVKGEPGEWVVSCESQMHHMWQLARVLGGDVWEFDERKMQRIGKPDPCDGGLLAVGDWVLCIDGGWEGEVILVVDHVTRGQLVEVVFKYDALNRVPLGRSAPVVEATYFEHAPRRVPV